MRETVMKQYRTCTPINRNKAGLTRLREDLFLEISPV